MKPSKFAVAAIASIVALTVQGHAWADRTPPTVKPPYHEAVAWAPSDWCGGTVFGDPQCSSSASASTDGTIAVDAEISGTSSGTLFPSTAMGVSHTRGLVRHYLNNGKKNGAGLTVTLNVQVPDAVATATDGDRAEVFIYATLLTTCSNASPSTCVDNEKVLIADSSGASACRPGCAVTLSIKAPADRPLGDGYVELLLVSHAELFNRPAPALVTTETEAHAGGRAALPSIEVVRS